MERTTRVFQKISFLNCNNKSKDNLVDSVILVPSAATSVQSDVTEGSISDQPQFACEGVLQEWLKELKARKAARQKAEAVKDLRQATSRQAARIFVLPLDSTNESIFEHEGIVFTSSDTAVNATPSHGFEGSTSAVYSKSLF